MELGTGSITSNGAILDVNDITDWVAEGVDRADYGLFIKPSYREEYGVALIPIETSFYFASSVETWQLQMIGDGEYFAQSYAFFKVIADPNEGDVKADSNDLLQWNGAEWVTITLDDAIDLGKYAIRSYHLNIPYLNDAYTYKNQLNLEYIAQVKGDISKGVDQNKLYYKRTDLDYFSALIDGALYNFAITALHNFYDIVQNLNDIRLNKQIS